jgi:hypothetical protein
MIARASCASSMNTWIGSDSRFFFRKNRFGEALLRALTGDELEFPGLRELAHVQDARQALVQDQVGHQDAGLYERDDTRQVAELLIDLEADPWARRLVPDAALRILSARAGSTTFGLPQPADTGERNGLSRDVTTNRRQCVA